MITSFITNTYTHAQTNKYSTALIYISGLVFSTWSYKRLESHRHFVFTLTYVRMIKLPTPRLVDDSFASHHHVVHLQYISYFLFRFIFKCVCVCFRWQTDKLISSSLITENQQQNVVLDPDIQKQTHPPASIHRSYAFSFSFTFLYFHFSFILSFIPSVPLLCHLIPSFHLKLFTFVLYYWIMFDGICALLDHLQERRTVKMKRDPWTYSTVKK